MALDPLAAGQALEQGAVEATGGAVIDILRGRLLAQPCEAQPGGEALHDKLYRAYFVDARNIGDPNVLVGLAQSVGLSAQEAHQVLAERRFKDAVDADWAKSHQYGVTGVPTFVAARYGVVGAQPYEVLEQLLDKAGARRRV